MSILKSNVRVFILLHLLLLSSNTVKAQNSNTNCTKWIWIEKLIELYNITDNKTLIDSLDNLCFTNLHPGETLYTTFEKRHERKAVGNIIIYNQLIYLVNGRVSEYMCSDKGLAESLISSLNKLSAYYYESAYDTNKYTYLLNDMKHVFEFSDVQDKDIGWGYRFVYRRVSQYDLTQLENAKKNDTFPKNEFERKRLLYRYALVDHNVNHSTINIKVGDRVKVVAGGEITLDAGARTAGVYGIEGDTRHKRIKEFNYGCLLYKIGSSNWEILGEQKVFTAEYSGELIFTVNAYTHSKDFWVDVSIIPAK